MATDTMCSVFTDFNELKDAPRPPLQAVEDAPIPFGEIGTIPEDAWTDGYLTGRHECGIRGGHQELAAKLLTAIYELDEKVSEAADAASLSVADLLVDTVLAVASDNWSATLLDRVRVVAKKARPALIVAPKFALRDDRGMEHCFGDLSELRQALEAGSIGEELSVHWQRGEATISRMALSKDLREAIIPILEDRISEQNARHQI